jgi:hypothetical protein
MQHTTTAARDGRDKPHAPIAALFGYQRAAASARNTARREITMLLPMSVAWVV